jgi:hypothetical protein
METSATTTRVHFVVSAVLIGLLALAATSILAFA